MNYISFSLRTWHKVLSSKKNRLQISLNIWYSIFFFRKRNLIVNKQMLYNERYLIRRPQGVLWRMPNFAQIMQFETWQDFQWDCQCQLCCGYLPSIVWAKMNDYCIRFSLTIVWFTCFMFEPPRHLKYTMCQWFKWLSACLYILDCICIKCVIDN